MIETPEQRLANRIIEQLDLSPPVAITGVARRFADLEIVEWPNDCDGLTVGLTSGSRPRIFVKVTRNEPRQRFTIAHELGHVLLPWHIEEVACSPEAETGTSFSGGLREREASVFASHILVPDRYLKPLCRGDPDMAAVLRALQQAEISAAASLIALVRSLAPGFAFVLDNDRVFASRGTVLPTETYGWWLHRRWTSQAAETGRARLRGKSVRWFKFEQFVEPTPVTDPRDTTTILRDAIAAVTDDPREQSNLFNVVNGVVGAAMAAGDNRSTPGRALGTMRHRLRARPDLMELMEEPDFDLFLQRRASSYGAT